MLQFKQKLLTGPSCSVNVYQIMRCLLLLNPEREVLSPVIAYYAQSGFNFFGRGPNSYV